MFGGGKVLYAESDLIINHWCRLTICAMPELEVDVRKFKCGVGS